MTSTFDNIASFAYWYKKGILTEEEEKEVFDILETAIIQASSRRPKKWNFDLWMETRWKGMAEEDVETFYGQRGAAKFSFLDQTHSVLDHDDTWHLKVFNRVLDRRIYHLHKKISRRLKG